MRNYDDDGTRSTKLYPGRGSPNITNYDTIIIIGARSGGFVFIPIHTDEFLKLYDQVQ